jgi:hypothetical protein
VVLSGHVAEKQSCLVAGATRAAGRGIDVELGAAGATVTEANWREAIGRQPHFAISETPHFVGRAVAALARDPQAPRWSGQSLSSGQLAKVCGFTDLDGSQPDAGRYLVEVQDAGKPADVTGYR